MKAPDGNLIFKPVSSDHLEMIHDLNSRPEVDEFNTLGIPKDISETLTFLEPVIEQWKSPDQSVYQWTVFLRVPEEFIGIAGMRSVKNRFRRGEVYYNLLPEYWGHGYGTEVLKWVIAYGFEELKLHRVEAGVAVENNRSIHLLEKVGMVREGRRRKILPIRGEWKDNYHYAILEEEYFRQA